GTPRLRHVLPQDLGRLRPHHEHRAEVADQGREHVPVGAALERVRRSDRLAFLPERADQAPDDLALAVQARESLLQSASEPQEASGVYSAIVDLATGEAEVDFNDDTATSEQLVRAVETAGYGARIAG